MNGQFWSDKRVLVTGHTGFKGAWLCLWLQRLGAVIAGYALPPPAGASLYHLAQVGGGMESTYDDIRNRQRLQELFDSFSPQIVFHLAAQSLVRKSYVAPLETYEVNVMGTAHLLEAVRSSKSCRVVVNVTSDKCYENREGGYSYRETDALGGCDPYSSSKACAELVTAAYRRSFFESKNLNDVAVATARAGNVIGGGDFAADRIVPDFMAALMTGKPLRLRNPYAVRPWQHVLEPLCGYLTLAEVLWESPRQHEQSWNFGPAPDDMRTVGWIVETLNEFCGNRVSWQVDASAHPHEAQLLMLDSTRARMLLKWKPRWTLERSLQTIVHWYDAYQGGGSINELIMQQIASFEAQSVVDSTQARDRAPLNRVLHTANRRDDARVY